MPKGKKGGLKGLGIKYGSTVRKRYSRIHSLLKLKRRCPQCGSWQLKRKSKGLWRCSSCGFLVAGGAYDAGPLPSEAS